MGVILTLLFLGAVLYSFLKTEDVNSRRRENMDILPNGLKYWTNTTGQQILEDGRKIWITGYGDNMAVKDNNGNIVYSANRDMVLKSLFQCIDNKGKFYLKSISDIANVYTYLAEMDIGGKFSTKLYIAEEAIRKYSKLYS